MRIYTGTGDDGTTGLFGGGRVSKDDLRVEAYGTVDELNSILGLAAASLPDADEAGLRTLLYRLQGELLDLGAELATLPENRERAAGRRVPRVTPAKITALEEEIDRRWEPLPPLRTFILPGGTSPAAFLHLARTVARRAERCTIRLSRQSEVGPLVLVYLNRLSDLLFALARAANAMVGVADVPWQPNQDDAPDTTGGR
ncbi:MAG: cob(I)yrinic acid a,c-diamide adenosyltransferase [Chloroflexota bacterium]